MVSGYIIVVYTQKKLNIWIDYVSTVYYVRDDISCTKSICYDKDQNLVCEQVQSIAANKKKLSDNLGWVCKPITGIKQ
jgi:hypothetical protein